MLIFSSSIDPQINSLPPPYRLPVLSALRTLLEICGPEPDPKTQGFVAFVEHEDTPHNLSHDLCRSLASIEGTFRDGPCLVGVLLWGNSGDGVTIVCPEEDGYASEIANIMKQHL